MVTQQKTQAELKYIAGVFFRTGAIAVAWFGLTGIALNGLSDRVSLSCNRGEESISECKLGVSTLLSKRQIDLSNQEVRQVSNRVMSNHYLRTLVQWKMEIATDRGQFVFHHDGLTSNNPWENFTDRTNRFLNNPQLRTLTITSEYSFWFKFLSQAVSGISILYGLFIIPSLYLTAKYGDNSIAHQQAVDRLFGNLTGNKSTKVTITERLK